MAANRETRTALITGGSSGIGLAFAEKLAGEGYDLILVARDQNRLETSAYPLRRVFGVNVITMPIDLTADDACDHLASHVEQIGVEPTLLVNNAGIATSGHFKDADPASISDMINLEVRALTQIVHAFLPSMIERGAGDVINVAAAAGFSPMPAAAVFGAVKAYVLAFSEALATEICQTGVRVTALCPAATDTRLLDAMKIEGIPRDQLLAPSEVAREGLEAVRAGEPVCIPGWENRLAIGWQQYLPRHIRRRYSGLLNRLMMDY